MTHIQEKDKAFLQGILYGMSYSLGRGLDFLPRNSCYPMFQNFGNYKKTQRAIQNEGLDFIVVDGPFQAGCGVRKINTLMAITPGKTSSDIIKHIRSDLGEDFPLEKISTGKLSIERGHYEVIVPKITGTWANEIKQYLEVHRDIIAGLVSSDLAPRGTPIHFSAPNIAMVLAGALSK